MVVVVSSGGRGTRGRRGNALARDDAQAWPVLAPSRTHPLTLRGLIDILVGEGAPDPEFADDLEAIQREQPPLGGSFWAT